MAKTGICLRDPSDSVFFVTAACIYRPRRNVPVMLKQKLNWKRPLFYALLPIFFVMAFLGFPLPVAPPPATKPPQEQTVVIKKKKQRTDLLSPEKETPDDAT
jgi:hypothetical protein